MPGSYANDLHERVTALSAMDGLVLPFFDQPAASWRSDKGCLHLYVQPAADAPILGDFARMAAQLSGISGLGIQPVEYMHLTLQRFDAFTHDLSDERWRRLLRILPEVLRAHSPFAVTFAPPGPNSHAVEAVGQPSPEWESLLADVRAAVADCGLARALTAPPSAPHYTVAYSIDRTVDAEAESALAPVATATKLAIEQVMLVAVDQDPDAGSFSFERLYEWKLGR